MLNPIYKYNKKIGIQKSFPTFIYELAHIPFGQLGLKDEDKPIWYKWHQHRKLMMRLR